MAGLLPDVDPDGLLEFSVVYTDRALNHMSQEFQKVMRDISETLKTVYNAESAVVVPGSGTFAMEAVARQFASGKHCLVVQNGWFSYRWSQIFEMCAITDRTSVFKARQVRPGSQMPFAPAPIEEVVSAIIKERPEVVFATHVETAAGMMLPDEYLRKIAEAVHLVGGLMVLDCIASGSIWVDMGKSGVDILISAPQKGWSSSPCCGLVMMNDVARKHIDQTTSDSFACDLKKWLQIMEMYESGNYAYHATMPTDGLRILRDMMRELEQFGFEKARESQQKLGESVRKLMSDKGFISVAAKGFEAPGVIVSYTDDPDVQNGKKFAEEGLQIAPGTPLQCDEPVDFQTFRLGLFGIDKLKDSDATIARLSSVFDRLF